MFTECIPRFKVIAFKQIEDPFTQNVVSKSTPKSSVFSNLISFLANSLISAPSKVTILFPLTLQLPTINCYIESETRKIITYSFDTLILWYTFVHFWLVHQDNNIQESKHLIFLWGMWQMFLCFHKLVHSSFDSNHDGLDLEDMKHLRNSKVMKWSN